MGAEKLLVPSNDICVGNITPIGDFMANSVVWIDIPVLNLDRAISFYSAVLGTQLGRMDYPGMSLGFLPGQESGGVFRVASLYGYLFLSLKLSVWESIEHSVGGH